MKGIRAVLFDFDDLMVNSGPLHERATIETFAQYGIAYQADATLRQRFCGRRVCEVLELIWEHYGLTLDRAAFALAREARFLELVPQALESMPGLAALTQQVADLELTRAVASSGNRVYVALGLRTIACADFFPVVVTCEDVTHGKPAPDLFLTAAQRLQVDPAHCVVLEDAAVGVQAARAAGMRVIGVQNPYALLPQDLSQADAVVTSLAQVRLQLHRGSY